jgi:hypothetical protein
MLGPARVAVPDPDFDIGITLAFEPLHGPPRQLVDEFEAVDHTRQFGEDRCRFRASVVVDP